MWYVLLILEGLLVIILLLLLFIQSYLEHPHHWVHSLLKYKNLFILHFLAKKTSTYKSYLEHPHHWVHSLLKYKNLFTLHFLAKKTPTGVKLCIYTPCYGNRAYMHDYCSSCIWFFFSLHLSLSLYLWSDSPPHLSSLSFPAITATQQRRRRQFSNHQLNTTQLSRLQPKPIEKPIPNPHQNQ